MPRTKQPKAKQAHIPTLEPIRNEEVHRAAVRYAEERDARIAQSKEEKSAKDGLLNAMSDAGLTSYEDDELSVFIDVTKNPKCKKKSASEGEE